MGKFFFLFMVLVASFQLNASEKVTKDNNQDAYERMEEPVNGHATIYRAWKDENGVFQAMNYISGQVLVLYPLDLAEALYKELSTAYKKQLKD